MDRSEITIPGRSCETIYRQRDFICSVIRLASYRPFHFLVAVALLLSMAMPLVTHACDLTGIIDSALPMADRSAHAHSTDVVSHCPCTGPMQDVCGSNAADCVIVVNCDVDSFESDACCSTQRAVDQAVVAVSKKPLDVPATATPFLEAHTLRQPVTLHVAASGHERAPPHGEKAPVHILQSSLLL